MNLGKLIRHALWNRLGAPAGASLAADLVTLQAILDDLELQYVEGSVVDGAPAAADFDTDLAEATDWHYDGMLLMFIDGVNAGQAHVIDVYLAANGNVAFSAEDIWTDVPGNGDNFIILPSTGEMAKAIYTRLDPRVMGRAQIAATTIDLNQGVATYVLFTGDTQDVMIEGLVIKMPNDVAGGALTSISIQTNDATPQIFITVAEGAVANLIAEAQLSWAPAGGITLLEVGKTIGLTIGGGAEGAPYVCDVVVKYRAVVSGGFLS